MSQLFAVLALAAILGSMSTDEGARKPGRKEIRPAPDRPSRPRPGASPSVQAIILAAAKKRGVPEAVAMATAAIESGFDPTEEGDKRWHEDAERFERVVPRDSIHRWDRKAWHSYGLFQLLAPYFVGKNEHPVMLLDPNINADRGTHFLARLMQRYDGDLDSVRLAYVGLPVDRKDALAERVLSKWHAELRKYGYDDPRL